VTTDRGRLTPEQAPTRVDGVGRLAAIAGADISIVAGISVTAEKIVPRRRGLMYRLENKVSMPAFVVVLDCPSVMIAYSTDLNGVTMIMRDSAI
jgi:hypothetical protein